MAFTPPALDTEGKPGFTPPPLDTEGQSGEPIDLSSFGGPRQFMFSNNEAQPSPEDGDAAALSLFETLRLPFDAALHYLGKGTLAAANAPSELRNAYLRARGRGGYPGALNYAEPITDESLRPHLPSYDSEFVKRLPLSPLRFLLPETSKGVYNLGKELVEGMVPPFAPPSVGLTAPLLAGGGAIPKAAATLFGGQALLSAPEQIEQANALPEGTPFNEVVTAYGRPVVGAGLGTLGLLHGASRMENQPKGVKNELQQAATEKALSQIESGEVNAGIAKVTEAQKANGVLTEPGKIPVESNPITTRPPSEYNAKDVVQLSGDDFIRAVKSSGKKMTRLSYDWAKEITSSDIPRMEQTHSQIREAVKSGQADPSLNWKSQIYDETIKMRKAMDEAISTGARTDEQLAIIAKKHGVGVGPDANTISKWLKSNLGIDKNVPEGRPTQSGTTETPPVLEKQLEQSSAASQPEIPAVENGKTRLYQGSGGAGGAGTGGSFFTSDPQRAASYGPNVQYVDVPSDIFKAGKVEARKAGMPTSTDAVIPDEWVRQSKQHPPIEQVVHDAELDVTDKRVNGNTLIKPAISKEYFDKLGDEKINPDKWIEVSKRSAKGDLASTESAEYAGLSLSSVKELDALVDANRILGAEMQKAMQKAKATKDFREWGEIGMAKHFIRETIEVATNAGGNKETARNKIGPRPLDFQKNPEVAKWLEDKFAHHGIKEEGLPIVESAKALDTAASTPPPKPPPPNQTIAAAGAERRGSPTSLDDIYSIFEPIQKAGTSLKQKAVAIAEAVRTGVSSKFRPINKLSEDIAKSYGLSKPKDIAGIMEQLKGSQGRGEADVYRFDRDVSDLVKGNEKDFNAYMFLRRGLDRLSQDQADIQRAMAGEDVPKLNRRAVAGYTINELTPKLQALEQKLGPDTLQKFQQAADRYQQQMDQALRLQVESGRMSQEVYQAIKAGNQFYAPFKVMKYLQETSKPQGTGAKVDTTAEFTKAMEGIEDPNFKLGDMLGAARQNLLISRILADKNNAMRSVAELAPFDVNHQFIRKLGPDEAAPHGTEAVTVMESGRQARYATRPEVAEALQLYGSQANSIISRVLSAASVPFRAGATWANLPFQISNFLADVPRQALVSKYGIRGVADLVRYPMDFIHSLYSSIAGDVFGANNKLFLDFLDSGVSGSTVQEHLTPNALRHVEPSTISRSKAMAKTVLNTIPNFATAIEQTSKVLGVKRAMRAEGVESGARLAKEIPEAITELRRFSGSPDFGRQGKWVDQARLNLLYMFLNARIQGSIADIGRLTGRDGSGTAARTWLKVGTAVGIPTAYLYALNHSNEYKDDYEKRPAQEKQNYWLIPKDSYITTEDGEKIRDYWRIPKREIVKWFANASESALDYASKRDPKSLGVWAESMLQEISPANIQGDTAQERMESVGSSLNPILKAPLEIATGRDMYRHRDLIPDSQQKASPELQYTDRTPEAFKKLAVAMPDVAPEFLRSPIIMENLTRNLTAGLITQFLPRKPVQGRSGLENQPLLQRFQALPYTDQQGFRDQINALEREAADEQLTRHRQAMKLLEDGKGKSLEQIVVNAPNDERLVRHMVDLWVAKENGATQQDRQLLALPVKQRAAYISNAIRGMTPEQQSEAIFQFARKRVLTEAVANELPGAME